MADPVIDEINTAVTKKIQPGVVDNYFKAGPMMRWIKEKRFKLFNGGSQIQENFLYGVVGKSDSYPRGGQFDLTRRQNKTGILFDLKQYYANISVFPEVVEVLLRTPEAAFSTIKTDMAAAAMHLSAKLENDIMRNGQNTAGSGDRTEKLNGLEEALNDGTTSSWAGNTFPTYGGQARNDVGMALKPAGSTPTGGVGPIVAANVNGAINTRVLEHSYQSCIIGDEHPVIGITSNRAMGFILENYMPLQQLVDVKEPTIGWPGVKYKQATILVSQYIPSQDGENDPDIGNYQTNSTIAELFMWLNPGGEGDEAYFRLHISASPKYQFGFTGFKPAQDSTLLAGQILFAGNFTFRAPRYSRILYGITK